MLEQINNFFRRIATDVQSGRNIEVYAVAIIGVAIVLVDIFESVPFDLKLTVVVASLALLLFNATRPEPDFDEAIDRLMNEIDQVITAPPDLDAVLQDRSSFTPIREYIQGASELWVCSPSAINLLRDSSYIEGEILEKVNGQVRFLLQDPDEKAAMDYLVTQLDQMSELLENDIRRALVILGHLSDRAAGNVQYRLLPFGVGFSLFIVDPHGRDGKLIVETFGFNNRRITDRMHIEITKNQSQHWFEYWVKRYEAMWDYAHAPETQE